MTMIRSRALRPSPWPSLRLSPARPRPSSANQQLLLKNGDRLTGTVVKREDGKIYFRSGPAGRHRGGRQPSDDRRGAAAPAQSLAGLPPEPPKEPEPSTPPITTPSAPATPTPAGATRSSPVVAVAPNRGPWWWPGWPSWPWVTRPLYILKPVVTKWTGKVEFGYGNELTNVRTVTTSVPAQADRNVGPDEVQLKALYLYGSTNSHPHDGSGRGRLPLAAQPRRALVHPGPHQLQLGQDPADQHRLRADRRPRLQDPHGRAPDPGRRRRRLVQYFDATGVEKGSDYLGNAFQDYTYKINGRYTFAEDASVQYSPERRGRNGVVATVGTPINTQSQNYDYKFHATLQGKVTNHLSLNLHFEYEYNNAVLDPHARADQHFITTLGYGF